METDCSLYILNASYPILPSTTAELLKDKMSITFKLSFTGLAHSCYYTSKEHNIIWNVHYKTEMKQDLMFPVYLSNIALLTTKKY